MGLRDRLQAAAVVELDRMASEIAAHVPHRDVSPSIVGPNPEELPQVLEQVRAQWRLGQPDIHQGERKPSPFLYESS